MAEIVRNWVTFSLGLEIPSTGNPEEFRHELANGILFAEVLRKYGILSDDEFVSLRHNNSRRSRAKNMLAIQHWVTRSGMPISPGMLMGVAQEQTGAGVKFLYELYLWLEDGCRQPEVGARAKSFLQAQSFSAAWAGSQFGSKSTFRSSLAPSELGDKPYDPCVPIERKWERSLTLDELPHPAIDLNNRQPNWYTTLDPVAAPASVVLMGPYKEIGEAGEAENKYFSEETIEVIRKQQNQLEDYKYQREKNLACMRMHIPEPTPWESYSFCPAQGDCERRLKKLGQECDQAKQALEEMNKFDRQKKLAKKNKDQKNVEIGRVYCDGRGDAEQMQRSVAAIKHRRQRMAEDSDARALIRRSASKMLASDIPSIMYYKLRDEVMDCISRLPSSERLLAEFIFLGHQQRQNMVRHTIYEVGQLKLARELDLAKRFQAKMAEEELELELSEFKLEQPLRSLVDPDEEAIRLDNEAMAEALLKNLTRLVIKVAAYRMHAGRECIEHDIYPATLDEGIEAEYRVVLDGNEFVMEPSRWGGLASDTALHEPDPPLLELTPEVVKEDDKFLIKHIVVILDRFLQVETGSLIPVRNFTLIIEDLILASIRCSEPELRREYLPSAWLQLTPLLLNRLISLLMGRHGFINWRNFIIACMDLPYPDQPGIIATLQQFQDLDPSGLFYTDKNGFDHTTLWFEKKKEDDPPSSLLDVLTALHFRECLFYLFADVQGHFYYVDFLLYFAKDEDPILGIVKALAVLTGRAISTANLTKGETLSYIRHRTSDTLLTDSEIALFLDSKAVPYRRGSLVPPPSPRRKFDFSSRMASMRQRYQLYTSGPAPEFPPAMEPNQSDPKALMARLTEEEEKTLTARLVETERRRKHRICAKMKKAKRERERHHHSRTASRKSSYTSVESDVRLHELDRLKLLFEKELEKEGEGESSDVQDSGAESKSGQEEAKTDVVPPLPQQNLEPPEPMPSLSPSTMQLPIMSPSTAPERKRQLSDGGQSVASPRRQGPSTAPATTGTVITTTVRPSAEESSPASGYESRESQTQTEEEEEEEEEEYDGEGEEDLYEEETDFGASTIPSEAFLQAIWFGHITSFPVNDPSFMSNDYFKYKEFLDEAYEELYEKAAMIDGEIYISYLPQILEHPFVVEIIRRFTTYRIVNLQTALKEVIASVTPKSPSITEPPVSVLKAHTRFASYLEHLGEHEFEGEYDSSPRRMKSRVRMRAPSNSKRSKRNNRRNSKKSLIGKRKSTINLGKKQADTETPGDKSDRTSGSPTPHPTVVTGSEKLSSTAASTSKKTKTSGKPEKKEKEKKRKK